MKPALRHLLVCALLLVAGFGAQAQGDEVLERYGLALVNLTESVRLLETDVPASRDELDRAAGALRFLAAEAGNPSLVEALERVFEHARTAISNRSGTDLAVQTALIRGGFQRAVFESAVGMLESEPAAARSRLERLANDLGFAEPVRAQLGQATEVGQVGRLFEVEVGNAIVQKLQQAQASYAESRDVAYRTLASAYGDFLLIQDSPRVQVQLNNGFGVAAANLVENDADEMNAAFATLGNGFRQLAEAARAQPVEQPQAGGGDSAGESAPTAGGADETAEAGDETASVEAPAAPQASGETAAEAGSQMAEMPSVSLGQVQANQAVPAAEQAPQGQSEGDEGQAAPDRTSEATDEAATTEAAARLQALRVELIAAGVPPARAAETAARLANVGVTDLESALNDLYAHAGRVVAAVQAGDVSEARGALAAFGTSYEQRLQPALRLISPAVDGRVTDLVESLSAVPALRAQDTLVLLGQVDAIGNLIAGDPASNVQITNAQATMLWAGWVRLATLIALALLAIVPLYLLNLAFGGGNRNWQLIGVSLFLLLLPVIYEGLASVGALAAQYSGIPVLGILLSFSMFHNPIAQVVWAAITAAAILFAVAGLYGICVQFGLLGSRRATMSDSQTIRSTAVVPDADTVVDWDEEF